MGATMNRSIALVVLAACDPPGLPDELLPRIAIVAPISDSEVPLTATQDACDLDVTVAVDIDNFDIVPVGTPIAEGEGHWHVVMVGREADTLLKIDDAQSADFHAADVLSGTRVTIEASLHD